MFNASLLGCGSVKAQDLHYLHKLKSQECFHVLCVLGAAGIELLGQKHCWRLLTVGLRRNC